MSERAETQRVGRPFIGGDRRLQKVTISLPQGMVAEIAVIAEARFQHTGSLIRELVAEALAARRQG